MKSKEEIEQLANEYGYASAYSKEEHKAFINGYTQCQEDMADKKYTEEDIKMYIKAFHLDVLEGIYSKEKLEWCNDWLKQNINKQD